MIGNTSPVLLLFGIIGLLLLAVGLIAAVITYVGKSRDKDREQALAEERARPGSPLNLDKPPAAAVAPAPAVPEPAAVSEAPAHPGEVMRVIRDRETGRVLVQVDGKEYAHIREIHDAQVGRRVLWAIADLVRFTGGMATNPQAVRSVLDAAPAQETAPARAPGPISGSVPSASPSPPSVQPSRPVSRPQTISSAPPLSTPRKRYSMVDYFRQGFQRQDASEPVSSSTSFIDEIEAILQESLLALPRPLPYEVHMMSGENGMLRIEVGNNAYGSPDEVPDPQIRQLIKSAVAEWEKR